MPVYLLFAAVIIVACVACNKISGKLGIPVLLAFILLGMFFGSDGIAKIDFNDFGMAEQVCSVALIFIMFYGGFGTKWSAAKPVAAQSILLSTAGVVMTAAITGVLCHFVLRVAWLESFLIGAVISSTDAASVFSILRSKRMNLRFNTASLLEVESGSNDPCSYMLTVIFLGVMSGEVSGGAVAYMVFAQIVYGLGFGVAIALASVYILKRFRFSAGFDGIFVFAIAILSYAAPAAVGGNGYLSAYLVGMIVGNSEIRNKASLVNFFDGITSLMQILLFFLLGLLSSPSRLPGVTLTALLIAVLITFVARPLTVFLLMSPFRSDPRQQLMVAWSGLRGAASIVFSVMVTISSAQTENDIFHIVFMIVLFSILIQGSLIPAVAKKLGMIDESADVMKTFTDYSDEVPVQFIQFSMAEEHPWVNMAICDITLPPDTILVLLMRNGEKVIPNGQTKLMAGDTIVLSAQAPDNIQGIHLTEKRIRKRDGLAGKQISELPQRPDMLIIMIKRKNQIIIPNGSTVLCPDDVLVINN